MSRLKLGIENAFHAGTGGRSQENMGLGFRAPSRWLFVAGIAFGAAFAQAATGVAVNRSQEIAVKVGMNATEVRQVLGRPANVFNYRIAPGPSWSYHVVGASYATTEFDVDFGSDGKVISAREREFPSIG